MPGERSDPKKIASATKHPPLNLLRVLTPSPASLLLRKPSDHNLVQTTWLRALPEGAAGHRSAQLEGDPDPRSRTPLPSAAWY